MPLADSTPEQWQRILAVNLMGPVLVSQAALPWLQAAPAATIVNISSIAALRADSGVYGATKHAVNCISATLRRELEDDTIRVVNVMPGAIATNFARNFEPAVLSGLVAASGLQVEPKRGERIPDEVFERLQPAMKQLLGRPEDVADAVLYAVTLPIHVNVADIVVRPAKQLNI